MRDRFFLFIKWMASCRYLLATHPKTSPQQSLKFHFFVVKFLYYNAVYLNNANGLFNSGQTCYCCA